VRSVTKTMIPNTIHYLKDRRVHLQTCEKRQWPN
jgi:hypothetical protein